MKELDSLKTTFGVRMGAIAIVGALAVGALVSCGQAILTAPKGSTIVLFANPKFIPAHGGVSVISALVTEGMGTPVSDGTVVQFFTTLGSIPEQAKTNDGVARVNLISDGRSGVATVTGVIGTSGGSSTPTSSTPATSTPSSTTSAAPGALSARGLGSVRGVAESDDETVEIGTVLPNQVIVTAIPNRLDQSRSAHIYANVFDTTGNPVANVPVFFRVTDTVGDGNVTGTEFMDSGGNPVFTDTNGRAEDVMRTRRPFGGPVVTVRVHAQVPGTHNPEGTADIVIN